MSALEMGDCMESSSMSYLFYYQIQDYKEAYYQKHQTGIRFSRAVDILTRRGKSHRGNPPKPDFLSWDLNGMEGLKALTRQIPVSAEEGTNAEVMLVDQIWHCYPRGDVQILLESCYAAPEFIMLDFFAVVYVLDGGCTLYLKDAVIPLETGGLCILAPRTPFYVMTGPEDLVIEIQSHEKNFREKFSQLLLYDSVLTAFFRRVLLENYRDHILFFLPPDRRICLLIQNLFLEYMTEDPYSSTAFNNFLQIFYLCVIRSTEATCRHYTGRDRLQDGTTFPAILEYMTQNFHTLTLDKLAGHFHYTSTYMSRLVRQMTGRSFRDIMTELRVREAKELLRRNLSCSETARSVGYRNPESFTYSFKKATGMTPQEYRKQNITQKEKT